MWDTKHLARQLPALFRGRSTSLGDVYAALVGREMHDEVRLARTTPFHPSGMRTQCRGMRRSAAGARATAVLEMRSLSSSLAESEDSWHCTNDGAAARCEPSDIGSCMQSYAGCSQWHIGSMCRMHGTCYKRSCSCFEVCK